MRSLLQIAESNFQIQVGHIKGHHGNGWNELADATAKATAKRDPAICPSLMCSKFHDILLHNAAALEWLWFVASGGNRMYPALEGTRLQIPVHEINTDFSGVDMIPALQKQQSEVKPGSFIQVVCNIITANVLSMKVDKKKTALTAKSPKDSKGSFHLQTVSTARLSHSSSTGTQEQQVWKGTHGGILHTGVSNVKPK